MDRGAGDPAPDRARAEALLAERTAQLRRRLEAAAAAKAGIAALRVTTSGADGAVRVTVSARGTLLDLQLEPRAAALDPDRLAAEVLRTVQQAAAQAAERSRALLEPAVEPGTDLDGLVLDPALTGADPESQAAPPGRPEEEDLSEHGSWLERSEQRGAAR